MAGTEHPSHRACAHCRDQKVRCIVDDATPDVCQRCRRTGRQCVPTPPQRRKQRKRTDTRVAELEKEMRAMRSMLSHHPEEGNEISSAEPEISREMPLERSSSDRAPATPKSQFFQHSHQGSSQSLHQTVWDDAIPMQEVQSSQAPMKEVSSGQISDVVSRGLISGETARQLVDLYRNDLFQHLPLVAMPTDVTVDTMRATMPILFLAIIAAAACKQNAETSALLDCELLTAYATRTIINSEKSLELVQALLISSAWFHPPSKFGHIKSVQYSHMATIMAMDLGISSRPREYRIRVHTTSRPANGLLRDADQHSPENVKNPESSMIPRGSDDVVVVASVESRRTFLACFVTCASLAVTFRRPSLLNITTYLKECIDLLEKSPQALESDRQLIALTKLFIIGDEICTSFSYSDTDAIALLTELRTQLMIRGFQNRLDAWWTDFSGADDTSTLPIFFYAVQLSLYEVGLHVEHSPSDFQAPHHMGPIQTYTGPEIPIPVLAEAITGCITSSHAICDSFLSTDVEGLRSFPVSCYVRLSYATFILVKLCLSAVYPRSRIAQVLDVGSLKVQDYMDRMIVHTRNIVGPTRCRLPAIFLTLLFKLRQWCVQPELIVQANDDIDQEGGEPISSGPTHIVWNGGAEQHPPEIDQPQPLAYNFPIAPISNRFPIDNAVPAAPYTDYNMTNTTYAPPPIEMSSTAPPMNFVGPTQNAMELDKDFMDLWNEMNGFPEGGLTGLEDWSRLPTDMTGTTLMSDMSTWPNLGGMMCSVMDDR